MIKKPTLIVLVCAILIGGAVYYFQWRSSKNPPAVADNGKAAFTMQSAQVTALAITHAGKTGEPEIRLAKQDGKWDMTQPIETGANQSAANGITDALASANITQTEPETPDRLKVYGLSSPRLELDFQLKDGTKHKILMGDKDFTGSYVYSLIDNRKNVSLLPLSIYDMSNKAVPDLRDRSVLHINSDQTAAIELKNPSGELALSKKTVNDEPQWNFSKPSGVLADSDSVSSLLSAIANGTFTKVEREKADDLAKYGLTHPAITFRAVSASGSKQTLVVGKKEGDNYFARDDSRPMVFLINQDLYKKLTQNFGELRDKDLVHFSEDDINRIALRNTNGTMELERKKGSDFDWTLQAPASVKGKTAASWKVFTPLTSAKADEIIDRPSAAMLSKFAKPAIEVDLTEKDGKRLAIKFSKAEGKFVYGQTSASPSVYKLDKSILKDLDFKASALAS